MQTIKLTTSRVKEVCASNSMTESAEILGISIVELRKITKQLGINMRTKSRKSIVLVDDENTNLELEGDVQPTPQVEEQVVNTLG